MHPPRLVCLGNLTIDDVYLPDGRHRPNCGGGNALYSSLAARLWEPCVEMIAPVGNDFSQELFARMSKIGMKPEILPRRDIKGIHNEVFYDSSGGRRWHRFTDEKDAHALSPVPQDIPVEYLNAEFFLVSAMTLDAQADIVRWLRQNVNGKIALDIREAYMEGNKSRIIEMIKLVDIFMPSEVEAKRLSNQEDWGLVAREFASLGPSLIVIKLGEKGSLIYHADSQLKIRIPAFPGVVIDTTGAGDSFCGGFLGMYMNSPGDLKLCGRAGAVASSFAISDFGVDGLVSATHEMATHRLATWDFGSPGNP